VAEDASPWQDGSVVELAPWWGQVSASALVGTARRPAPRLSPALGVEGRPDADPETALLDQLALGGAWLAAGVAPGAAAPAAPAAPAPAEHRPLAPARALHLLDVVLTQPPGGQSARDGLLALWADECARGGFHVPHRVLPELLELVTTRAPLRPAVLAVVGERGRWLAAQSPSWRVLLEDSAPSASGTAYPSGDRAETEATHALPDDWLQRPAASQVRLLTGLRRADPGSAREALATVWTGAPAKDRLGYLGVLATGLGADDEELLEAALDDRAATVRAGAAQLLERLPTSRRAARMAARLEPLVSSSRGLFRRSIAVELPDDPDPAGVRDGLGPAPQGRSVRGHHLEQIVAGAPLGAWARLTEAEPADLLRHLGDAPDVLAGLRRAAVAQGDRSWARALIEHDGPGRDLLLVLDPAQAEELIVERLDRLTAPAAVQLLAGWPGPWSPRLSALAIAQLQRDGLSPIAVLNGVDVAADRLHAAAVLALGTWVQRLTPEDPVRVRLARLLSSMTFRQSISEAFR